jgi:hypothetical protein
MEEKKPWYTSRTVIVGGLQVAVGTALAAGIIDETAASEALSPEVVGGIATAALGVASAYYRIKAEKQLSK